MDGEQSRTSWVVLKFGGTSVSGLDQWCQIHRIVQQRLEEGFRPWVVCSAASRVTGWLEEALAQASRSEPVTALDRVIERYADLANALSLEGVLDDDLAALTRLIEGVSLVKEASPRVQAQVLAYGELMLTRLGQRYLLNAGLSVAWKDARTCLNVIEEPHQSDARRYLTAQCVSDFDAVLSEAADNTVESVIMTQGFIAGNEKHETVLLGRGGSDVSAAYFSAKLGAARCEIWTDVPGVYTANPQDIPEARRLRFLDYDEAQEIASMGGKVLHPNCVSPLKHAQIPLHVKYTQDPDRNGTIVSSESDPQSVQIKSILIKYGIVLLSIETIRMWHEVGFLAEITSCFKRHGVSIDLVSTSESTVTVSLDQTLALNEAGLLDRLLSDLSQFARAKVIGPCASISLVGHNIRAILHKLGGVFEVFESHQVHLLSQAANDLNLTFVVDEDQAARIARQLHTVLIDQHPRSAYLSLSWQEEFGSQWERPTPWWVEQQAKLLKLAERHSPAYVYENATLDCSAKRLLSCNAIDRVFYAMKANGHPEILKRFYERGIHMECVSPEEIETVRRLWPAIDPQRILFTPNFAARSEYQYALEFGVYLTVDSLYPLEHWPDLFAGREIIIRVDPGQGEGHHKYVITGGDASKFGIPMTQLERVIALAHAHNIKIIGLHVHSGSGILKPDNWRESAELLMGLLGRFPQVSILNLGGGLGVPERPGQQPLDMKALDASLKTLKEERPDVSLWLEPGRFLVAQSGVILAKVTQIKSKGETCFVGIETGMNSLIRPALYGAYHEIVNLTRLGEPNCLIANIVGPICESGDTLGYARHLPKTEEGDVLLIANAGAYGRVMASHYNLRAPAEEYFID